MSLAELVKRFKDKKTDRKLSGDYDGRDYLAKMKQQGQDEMNEYSKQTGF